MIEVSIQPIRDATFWLLMNLVFWLTLVAAEKPKLRQFVLLGIVWTLATLTRMEGWLLLIPIIGWTASRVYRTRQTRKLLFRAGGACVLAMVTVIAAANLMIATENDRPLLGRFDFALPGLPWLHAVVNGTDHNPRKPVFTETEEGAKFLLPPTTADRFFDGLIEGLESLNAAALALGLLCGWKLLRDTRIRILLVHAAILMTAIWCRVPGERYFCQVFVSLLPFVASGTRVFVEGVGQWLSHSVFRRDVRVSWSAVFLGLVAMLYVGDAVTSKSESYPAQMQLSQWYRSNFSAEAALVTDCALRQVRFFAIGPNAELPWIGYRNLPNVLLTHNPDVVIYMTKEHSLKAISSMVATLQDRGYRQISPDKNGGAPVDFMVWTRQPLQSVDRHAAHTGAGRNRRR